MVNKRWRFVWFIFSGIWLRSCTSSFFFRIGIFFSGSMGCLELLAQLRQAKWKKIPETSRDIRFIRNHNKPWGSTYLPFCPPSAGRIPTQLGTCSIAKTINDEVRNEKLYRNLINQLFITSILPFFVMDSKSRSLSNRLRVLEVKENERRGERWGMNAAASKDLAGLH